MTLFANVVIAPQLLKRVQAIEVLEEVGYSDGVVIVDIEGGWLRNAFAAAGSSTLTDPIAAAYCLELISRLSNRGCAVRLVGDGDAKATEQLARNNIVAPAIVIETPTGELTVSGLPVRQWRAQLRSDFRAEIVRDLSDFIDGAMGTFLLPPAGSRLIYVDRYVKFIRFRSGRNYADAFERLFKRWIGVNRGVLNFDVIRVDDEGDSASLSGFFKKCSAGLRRGQKLSIRVFQVAPSLVHKRLLLNNAGGIQFDFGLDETLPGGEEVVEVLTEKVWQTLLNRYRHISDGQPDHQFDFEGS